MHRLVLLGVLFISLSITGYAQSNSKEILEILDKRKPCEIRDKADLILESYVGVDVEDSLLIYWSYGKKVFQCDPKSSNKYFNKTLDLAEKTDLFFGVYREIFAMRMFSDDHEVIRRELTFLNNFLKSQKETYLEPQNTEYFIWLTKELISIERTLKNYVKAKEISESLIPDLEKNNDFRNLLSVEDLLISICIEQSHFKEGLKHVNKFLKTCEDNFTKLDEEQINDMYFKQIFKLDFRLSLSDTLSVNDFLPVENYYKEHKKENKIELAYLGYLKIRNALNKYDFSKNADNLIGLDKLFKEIEKLGILDFITEEQYYPVKYIYSVYSKNQTIDNRNTSLNPVINLSYNIQNKNFLKGDSIISQMVKSAMNLNRFKGFSSEEVLMSRNTSSGLIINALGNYFIENKNVLLLSDLYSNYNGALLTLNRDMRSENDVLCNSFSSQLKNTVVDYSQFNKVYSLSIESEIVKNDDYLSGISDSICKSLGEDEVFIQWIYVPYRFDFKNFTSIESPFYIQLSYFKNGTINYHILEDGEGVNEAINYWKNQLINQNEIDEKIISQITTPFLKEIVGYKKIILCPSGRLIEIPFESISISGDFILNTHKTLVVNSAKSYLDNFKHDNFAQKPEGNFVFVGSESYKTSTSSSFSNLPGVKKEKDLLETICTKSEIKSEFYFNDGLEESHLKNIEKPYILHIAAHGILFSDSSIVKNQNLLRQTESVSTEDFYSGIVFSNASSHTPLVKNDQVLNEQEFSLLDLRKTHLVTLSSCFSGNGQETLGDGVMGFRKAIAETGAKYTLVSNWSIDDQITVEFMSQFYKCILELKMDVETAYRSTQLELKSKYKYPVYWASFTLIKN
jgi:CHAT domain-containing protein